LRHRWNLAPREAAELQRRLAGRVETRNRFGAVRLIGGVDASFKGDRARAAVVVMTFPDLRLVEDRVAESRVTFPYVPGLLSFREIPALLAAWRKVRRKPDLVLCDGHGFAHPRRFGLASHLGVYLEHPAIGCAKSLLCGRHGPLAAARGSTSPLRLEGEVIGAAVRTRAGVAPVYVSSGHRVGLSMAIDVVISCAETRIPEPIRRADRLTKRWGDRN